MRQVFANLLDNALKYTPEGGAVRLSCGIEDGRAWCASRTPGSASRVGTAANLGRGYIGGIRSRSQRGLGLGLSLVKAIVEAHHGEVSVRSEPAHGSAFTVTLPG
jgi:signal transduction histidine kinase